MSRSLNNTLGVAISAILMGGLAACGGGGGGSNPPPVNHAPTIELGDNIAQRELTDVSVMASVSDEDGDAVSVSWQQTDGPDLGLGTITGETLAFALPDVDSNETYVFTATADDGKDTASDTLSVTATINGIPVVTIDGPTEAREGDTVQFMGSAIDPDGNAIIGYTWVQTDGPDLGLGTVTGDILEFDLTDVDNDTAYVFDLQASDDVENGYASMTISSLANRAPEVTITAPGTVNELANVDMTAAGNDPEGDSLSYSWEYLGSQAGISLTSNSTAATGFTAPVINTNAVAAEFRVTVTDDAAFPQSTVENVTVSIAQEALIIFSQVDGDGEQIFQVDTAGNRRKVFGSTSTEWVEHFVLSPDRSKLAVRAKSSAGRASVQIVDLQTLDVVNATISSALPYLAVSRLAWSPDSRKLAYRADATVRNVYELVVVNADGSNRRIVATPFVDNRSQLTGFQLGADGCWDSDTDCGNGDDTDVTADILDFKWSPDSNWLAFRMQATPHVPVQAAETTAELKTVRLSDDRIFVVSQMFVQRVTDGDPATGPDCNTGAVWCWEADTDATPDYRPDAFVSTYEWKSRSDGQWLAYRSFERRNSADLLNWRIWVTDAMGGQRTQLTRFEIGGIDKVNVEDWAWSPQGDYIAWTERLVDAGATYSYRFVTSPFEPGVTPTDGNPLSMASFLNFPLPDGSTSTAGRDFKVNRWEWSPDNHKLAFTATLRHPAVKELYVMDRDWSLVTDGVAGVHVVGDLFRDDYNCSAWDGPFYGAINDGFASDNRWDTDGRCNKNGTTVDLTAVDGLPDGAVGDNFAWNEDGSALFIQAALRMDLLWEHYRWMSGTGETDLMSDMLRDKRNNQTSAAIPDGIADTASGDATNLQYGIPAGEIDAGKAFWEIVRGSGVSPMLAYIAAPRYDTIPEAWISQADGSSIEVSDLFHDGDGDGIPDTDGINGSPDGLPDGDAALVISLGGTRLLYAAGEHTTVGGPLKARYRLAFVDTADIPGTRTYLSEEPVAGGPENVWKVLVAFPDGSQVEKWTD